MPVHPEPQSWTAVRSWGNNARSHGPLLACAGFLKYTHPLISLYAWEPQLASAVQPPATPRWLRTIKGMVSSTPLRRTHNKRKAPATAAAAAATTAAHAGGASSLEHGVHDAQRAMSEPVAPDAAAAAMLPKQRPSGSGSGKARLPLTVRLLPAGSRKGSSSSSSSPASPPARAGPDAGPTPIVFIHGLGVGLLPYTHLLERLQVRPRSCACGMEPRVSGALALSMLLSRAYRSCMPAACVTPVSQQRTH